MAIIFQVPFLGMHFMYILIFTKPLQASAIILIFNWEFWGSEG